MIFSGIQRKKPEIKKTELAFGFKVSKIL